METTNTSSRTQIVATLGPASEKPETLRAMIAAGMDVARLNLAWGPEEEHRRFIRDVRAMAEEVGKKVPILCDLAGPRVQEGGEHHFGEKAGSIITVKDRADVAVGVSASVEYFALSYVGGAADIEELRQILKDTGSTARIIAKIERPEAVEHIEGIIRAADGIMVARGDLGNALPFEQVPFVQHRLTILARALGKPVIVATEMMTSMIEGDRPSRADVTDVAFAVVTGADAVMLSNETTAGKDPVAVIAAMEKIVSEAEKHSVPFGHRAL